MLTLQLHADKLKIPPDAAAPDDPTSENNDHLLSLHCQDTSSQNIEQTPPNSPDNQVLFVGDLARFCCEENLRAVFDDAMLEKYSPVNPVLDVVVKRSIHGINLGYGFVWMKDHESAQYAMDVLNGTFLCGRPLRIGWGHRGDICNPKQQPNGLTTPVSIHNKVSENPPEYLQGSTDLKRNKNSIYVKYTATQHVVVTEMTLMEVFQRFGEIVDVSIRSSHFDMASGIQTGFAFVHFSEDVIGVASSLRILHKHAVFMSDGLSFLCEPSKNFLSLLKEIPYEVSREARLLAGTRSPLPNELQTPNTRFNRGFGGLEQSSMASTGSSNFSSIDYQNAYHYAQTMYGGLYPYSYGYLPYLPYDGQQSYLATSPTHSYQAYFTTPQYPMPSYNLSGSIGAPSVQPFARYHKSNGRKNY